VQQSKSVSFPGKTPSKDIANECGEGSQCKGWTLTGAYESFLTKKDGVHFMQMTATLTTPPLVAEYDFSTGKYKKDGIGQLDPDGTHLITWLIGSVDTKSREPKDFEAKSGVEQWVSGQFQSN
jgi:hypothetical protein